MARQGACGFRGYLLKFAWTDVSFVITTWQVGAAPEHAPAQLRNCAPAGGVAVSVTSDASANLAEQLPVPCLFVPPQLIAPSSLETRPLLLLLTDRLNAFANVAPTFRLRSTTSAQTAVVPLQAPLHPVKTEPEAALAVSVTAVPSATNSLHLLPQLIALSYEATWPLPTSLTVIDGTTTFAAAICALMNAPTSSADGTLHRPSAHSASCVIGS